MEGLQQQVNTMMSLESKVNDELRFLKEPDALWYPSDFSNFNNQQAKQVRPAVLTVLVGNTLTEEALPTYMAWLIRMPEINDKTGVDQHPWAIWTRRWTAEEDRHGAVLSRYLVNHPIVDMGAVDRSQFDLIATGFDLKTGPLPYNLLIYTSFQEKATQISHYNTGILAGKDGDLYLEEICLKIAGDEARHAMFYSTMMKHIFDADVNGALLAYQEMMKIQIAMPAERLKDRQGNSLFEVFSKIAQKEGIYTSRDYVGLIEHYNKFWNIADRQPTTDEAKKAQEYLLGLPRRYARVVERTEKITPAIPPEQMPWIKV